MGASVYKRWASLGDTTGNWQFSQYGPLFRAIASCPSCMGRWIGRGSWGESHRSRVHFQDRSLLSYRKRLFFRALDNLRNRDIPCYCEDREINRVWWVFTFWDGFEENTTIRDGSHCSQITERERSIKEASSPFEFSWWRDLNRPERVPDWVTFACFESEFGGHQADINSQKRVENETDSLHFRTSNRCQY